ncbi:MAG: hypothetical protein HYZ11_01615 [Candidatus Tectomicrobia bacterium]|uniref:Uncharacterized protein n=1 Tax=Tectimicrobiota bacterium TaxID=2528274 RepID=A0A932HXM0_UNCTE|nr:hypothetical protein [Candidatus Tectomicrobia bacterium]
MNEETPEAGKVWMIQLGILALFWVFVIGIIAWIVRLIRISLQLRDIPSASIGISLVAIPVFILLLSLANYVFWGLRSAASQGERSAHAGKGGIDER